MASTSDYFKRMTRHFKALTRKNMILWYRTPWFSALEIILPMALMIVLCIIRAKVPFTFVDEEGMLRKKGFAMPGIPMDEHGVWTSDKVDDHAASHKINKFVRPFAEFADYTGFGKFYSDPEDYNVGYDYTGPQMYAPSHCMRSFDYNKPGKSSPLIAIIGKETYMTEGLLDYY